MLKKMLLAAAVAALSLAQGGCALSAVADKLTPEDAGELARSLAARCGGSFKVYAGADTGQLGGTARASLEVDANCPPPSSPPLTVGAVVEAPPL
jgi:hypothetical protein